jgi:hypothetical protein
MSDRDTQGRFAAGNPGRKPSSRNNRPALSGLLPSDATARLYEKAYTMALSGDAAMIRMLLDRLDPAPKGRPVMLPTIPEIAGAEDVVVAGRAVLDALYAGDLTPDEAAGTIAVLHRHVQSLELPAHEANLERLRKEVKELETLYHERLAHGTGRPPYAGLVSIEMPAQQAAHEPVLLGSHW